MSTVPLFAHQLPQGRLVGREVFRDLIRDGLAAAASEGWSCLMLSDAPFQDWPLGERAVLEMLNAWAQSGRTFTMLACQYDDVVRQHARFVQWRTRWSHIIDCRVCPDTDAASMPSVLWSPHWMLHRIDPGNSVMIADAHPASRAGMQENLSEWVRSKSTPGFASTVLGL